MRRNDAGLGFFEILIIVAILLIIAVIAIPYLQKKATLDIQLRGWVRNVNVIYDYDTTYVAFEKEGDITPQSYKLVGKHPELWQGEHVWLKLRPRHIGYRYDVIDFKRLGPDDKSGQLPNSP